MFKKTMLSLVLGLSVSLLCTSAMANPIKDVSVVQAEIHTLSFDIDKADVYTNRLYLRKVDDIFVDVDIEKLINEVTIETDKEIFGRKAFAKKQNKNFERMHIAL